MENIVINEILVSGQLGSIINSAIRDSLNLSIEKDCIVTLNFNNNIYTINSREVFKEIKKTHFYKRRLYDET